MPIRINLLAEVQALEDMRRRDPVKRAIYVAVLLVLAILVWSSSLQLKSMIAKGELSRLEGQIGARNAEYKSVLEKQRRLSDTTLRLAKLHELASNRVLYGTILNSLQQNTMDDVQLVPKEMMRGHSRVLCRALDQPIQRQALVDLGAHVDRVHRYAAALGRGVGRSLGQVGSNGSSSRRGSGCGASGGGAGSLYGLVVGGAGSV
jgi:uncharacterized membrane protein YgcG